MHYLYYVELSFAFTLGLSCFGFNASHIEERLLLGTIISIVR